MTRKDYVAAAAAIKGTTDRAGNLGLTIPEVYAYVRGARAVALELAYHFASDNPRFDTARFLKACGVQS